MNNKEIALFEDSLIRLFHVGRPMEWIALHDSEDEMTLLCELISANSHEYMKKKYGWNIPKMLSHEPKNTLLLLIQKQPKKLLRVFERGNDFSISMVPELVDFYKISEQLNLTGAKLLFTKTKFSARVLVLLISIIVVLIAFTYLM